MSSTAAEAQLAENARDAGRLLELARGAHRRGDDAGALAALSGVVDASGSFAVWQAASALLGKLQVEGSPLSRRTIRAGLLGTYTTSQLAAFLKLAALWTGVHLELYEGGYDQLHQEALDENSSLYAFAPDHVVLAVHAGALQLPALSRDPDTDVRAEVDRWRGLWGTLAGRTGARVVQHNFALPPEVAAGHLAARLPGSRHAMTARVNAELGEAAGETVSIVDCERLAGTIGKERWFDPRYWHISKQAVALEAIPLLARHTAAVLAAGVGLSRRCVVCDLDNTLWGGVIGEEGLEGIEVGGTPDGEAYLALQDYLRQLRDLGVVLAVASKNLDADARRPFEEHPGMRLRLEDFVAFDASWDDKATALRRVADAIGIGLDSLVLLDDNPAERALVRRLLPEVAVIELPPEPSGYVGALARYPLLEPQAVTREDAARTASYHARAGATALRQSAASIEEFLESLHMTARIGPFSELDLPRVVQLLGKTNQLNLTTRRHDAATVRAFMDDPDCVDLSLRLRDRFGDHGLVGVLIGRRVDDALDIDTLLLSCRVIGRTAEHALMACASRRAAELGCTTITGTFEPTDRNQPASDVYPRLGFTRVDSPGDGSRWEYDLVRQGPVASPYIEETPE
jgi:FkbH-like protein